MASKLQGYTPDQLVFLTSDNGVDAIAMAYLSRERDNALELMNDYGGKGKFVADNIKVLEENAGSQRSEIERLVNETNQEISALGNNPDPVVVDEISAYHDENVMAIAKKYESASDFYDGRVFSLVEVARQSIDKAEKEAERERQEAEAARAAEGTETE